MDKGMHVGGVEIVLLVPSGCRQHNVRIETARGHPEVERDDEVELSFRRRITPYDFLRLRFLHLAEVFALQAMAGAKEMTKEIFVAFAGRAEQVRAPDKEIAREIGRVVRIFAGHLEAAGLHAAGDMILDRGAGTIRFSCDRQWIDGKLRRRGQPSHALRSDIEIDETAAV